MGSDGPSSAVSRALLRLGAARGEEPTPARKPPDCRESPVATAEGEGFEPSDELPRHWFSRPAHSTALPPPRWCGDRSRGATVDSVKNMLRMYMRRAPRLSDPTDVYDHTVTL